MQSGTEMLDEERQGARPRAVREAVAPARGKGQARRGAARPAGDAVVYDAIFEAIVDQRLPPGTKLTEESLAGIFGVSRAVVRKALLRLAHDKVVEIRPNRGAAVAQPTPEEAREVFEGRRLIEGAVIRTVAARARPREIARLRRMVADEIAAARKGARQAAIRLSGAFHMALAEIAGNAVYADFLRELVSRTSLIIALYEAPGHSACVVDEHAALVDAIEAHDPDRAADLMARHLHTCETRLDLDRRGGAIDLKAVFAPAASRARAG